MHNFNIAALVLAFVALTLASPLNLDLMYHRNTKRNGDGSAVTAPAALRYWYQASPTAGVSYGRNPPSSYICYKGKAANFPPIGDWANFNLLWDSAVQYSFKPYNLRPAEITNIKNAIMSISQESKVDPRVILSVVRLESGGNIRVGCTESFDGVKNCGLMQSYEGSDYNPRRPVVSTNLMIQDGTQGTASGPGLVQLLNDGPDTPAQRTAGNIWKALRFYNSGSANFNNLSDGRGATDSYVSNVANYLQGWNGYGDDPATFCDFRG